MKNILFIVLGLFVLCNACIEDDSRLPDKPISEITISYDSDSINVDVNAELIYDPEIEQTGNLPLTYEWSYQTVGKNNSKDSLRFLSDERVLK
ncbi:MAG: hypothetical protein K2I90_00450, partial [Odoribacter sp.]|nr:hypothetical protein [Odoribacter sp.]